MPENFPQPLVANKNAIGKYALLFDPGMPAWCLIRISAITFNRFRGQRVAGYANPFEFDQEDAEGNFRGYFYIQDVIALYEEKDRDLIVYRMNAMWDSYRDKIRVSRENFVAMVRLSID